jgi:5-methyltetrahydrofolate--homocysteine methyltransferase
MATAGQQVFRLVRRLREELGVNSTCGASNVSFGMPDRERINAAFLPMAIASGLTSAITNPLAAEVKAAIMAADVLMGNDRDASRWIRAHRAAAEVGAAAERQTAATRTPDLVALPGGAQGPGGVQGSGGAQGSRPRINRRALAAAAAMRDAGQRG